MFAVKLKEWPDDDGSRRERERSESYDKRINSIGVSFQSMNASFLIG